MSEVAPLISDLATILIIAGIITVIFKWLGQPVIVGYIVAGIMAGPSISLFPTVSDQANIKIWADIGVIFLLFAIGLDFSFRKLISVGASAIFSTVIIVCGMMFLGYTAGNAMGFSHTSCIFLGGMLSMSSTAIVFKAFSDMGLLDQKFTGIVLGILIIEDVVAVIMMVVLSTLAVGKHFEGFEMLESILKLAAFLIFWSALGIYLIPTLLKRLNRFISNEILLTTSLGLCLGMVMIATKAGFSAALGAFVMGSLLAETDKAEEIAHIVQPVKDLFASVFFVSVGMMIDPAMIWEYAVPVFILTALVLCGQVLFGSFGVLLSGQPLKIAIQAGFSLAQVGEFAFIIASLGISLNVMDKYLYPGHSGSIGHHHFPYSLYDKTVGSRLLFCRQALATIPERLPDALFFWNNDHKTSRLLAQAHQVHVGIRHPLSGGMPVFHSAVLLLCVSSGNGTYSGDERKPAELRSCPPYHIPVFVRHHHEEKQFRRIPQTLGGQQVQQGAAGINDSDQGVDLYHYRNGYHHPSFQCRFGVRTDIIFPDHCRYLFFQADTETIAKYGKTVPREFPGYSRDISTGRTGNRRNLHRKKS